jgi:hypothetical protein
LMWLLWSDVIQHTKMRLSRKVGCFSFSVTSTFRDSSRNTSSGSPWQYIHRESKFHQLKALLSEELGSRIYKSRIISSDLSLLTDVQPTRPNDTVVKSWRGGYLMI